MRRRGGWRGNVSCGRRKRIVSTRCLNSASRFWSSTWTWAAQLTHQNTGQTHTGETLQSSHHVQKIQTRLQFLTTCHGGIYFQMTWQLIFFVYVVMPRLFDRDKQLSALRTHACFQCKHYFWGVWLAVSASLVGTVVPVF